ncbi:MAG: DUF72 domain-containing protein [Anaerolineales bacterium]|nr:DUF72 domain-containing protein [Anaerolineales bacterium]
MNNIRIGTCSWKYPSWKGLVYSEAPVNFLQEYAQRYSTVEIDQWFWSLFPKGKPKLPEPALVEEYRKSVPEDFRFTIKAPNSITLTHYYAKEKSLPGAANRFFLSTELAAEFLETLAPLKQTLGPLIFQFEYLNRQKMASQQELASQLTKFRKRLPGRHPYAVEIRNGNYFNERFLDFLLDQDWQLVLLQGYWMPSIAEMWTKLEPRIRRFRTVIFRLHGTGREQIEKETGKAWNRIVTSREKELADIAGIVKDLSGGKNEIYVNINNHYEGSAPLTIERFQKFLKG